MNTNQTIADLREIQESLGLPDGDFARTVKLGYSGSSWGKMKSGTFSGNAEKALRVLRQALAVYRSGGAVEVKNGIVVLPHVQAALDAVQVSRVASDEHRLVVVSGDPGSGKSETARLINAECGGIYMHARPSWAGSYLRSLEDIARALGLAGDMRSTGQAEAAVISALGRSPTLLVIDEANHFSRELINMLKAVINETRCSIVLLTIPGHLARMSATHSEESRQLLRRAVAIIHIPPVSTGDILAIAAGLYPDVAIGTSAPAVAAAANRLHRMDTVRRIFDEADQGEEDLRHASERVEKSLRPVATR